MSDVWTLARLSRELRRWWAAEMLRLVLRLTPRCDRGTIDALAGVAEAMSRADG